MPLNRKSLSQIKATDAKADDLSTTAVGKNESTRLFLYATGQRLAGNAAWFPEYGILHRMNIADINNKLAICKKEIYEFGSASDAQMQVLRELLDEQATAIRNFEYIQSQDWYIEKQTNSLQDEVSKFFPEVAKSDDGKTPYDSENYHCLTKPPKPYEHGDPLRNFLCYRLPREFTYSAEEREDRYANFQANYAPTDVSVQVERLARFIIAMFGALSILVPMIIMSLNTSKTKSLITTSVAVIIFASCCSLTFQTTNDQTLAATAGYAAVLMVFVGLTS